MGPAPSGMYNVPRPNPKNPYVTKCTPNALTQEKILDKEINERAIINAENYCNSLTNNPELVNGFNSFAGLAEDEKDKYGELLYNRLKIDIEKNIEPFYINKSSNVIDDPTESKAVIAFARQSTGVSIVSFNAIYKELNGFLKEFDNNVVRFAKIVSLIFPVKLFRAIINDITDSKYNRSIPLTNVLVVELIKDKIRTIAKLTSSIIKLSAGFDIQSGAFLANQLQDVSERVEGTKPRLTDSNLFPFPDESLKKAYVPGFFENDLAQAAKIVAGLAARLAFGYIALPLTFLSIADAFITLLGRDTIPYAISYCNNIGDRFEGEEDAVTEWAVYDNEFDKGGIFGGGCYYNTAEPGYKLETSFGCGSKGDCAWPGSGLRCIRQNFRADPFVCCFLDHSCNGSNEDTCFQTPARQRTCHPNFRDLSSSTCRDIVFDYCSGDILLPGQNDWLEMWVEDSFVNINSKMEIENNYSVPGRYNDGEDINVRGRKYPIRQKQPCVRAIARAVSSAKICNFEDLKEIELVEGSLNTDGFIWSKRLLERAFERYLNEGGSVITGVNTNGLNRNSSFYNTLWEICNKIPGLCTNILEKMCSNYTSEDVSTNPLISPWCSCYLPEEEYEKYTFFGVTKECTPLCNRSGVIPTVSGTGQQNICLQTICILDNVSVNLINTQFSGRGEININQICGSCGISNIRDEYNFGSISEENVLNNKFNIPLPPFGTAFGEYLKVYGSGFNLNRSELDISIVIPKGDYENESYKDKLATYPRCLLFYAYGKLDENVGVIGVNFIPGGRESPEKGKDFILGIDINGNPLFENDGTPATVEIIETPNIVDIFRSKNTTIYGQSKREASVNTCSCISSGFSLKAMDSKISGKINFTQECGSSFCYDENNLQIACTDTNSEPKPVDTIDTIESKTREELEKNKLINMFFSASGLAILVFIFFVAVFFYKSCFKIIYTLLNKLHTSSEN